MRTKHFLFVLVLAVTSSASASAAPLPGGAGSLVESYEDWMVSCTAPEGEAICTMRQSQSNQETGQNVLTAELRPTANGTVEGRLLMPFGLALAQGVALSIDETEGPTFAFATCVPQGCIAPVRFDEGQAEGLKTGGTLRLTVHAIDAEQPIAFTVSLKGFTAALQRISELTQ